MDPPHSPCVAGSEVLVDLGPKDVDMLALAERSLRAGVDLDLSRYNWGINQAFKESKSAFQNDDNLEISLEKEDIETRTQKTTPVAPELPTPEASVFVPRRQFRPRTIKQLRPYLVDRYEHEAQIRGDAERAHLIEQAAAEQNEELLEHLRAQDAAIRKKRMLDTLQREKAPKTGSKHKRFNNRVLESDLEEQTDVLERLLGDSSDSEFSSDPSPQSSSEEEEEEEDDFGLLRHRLEKAHVLPRSYMRQVKDLTKRTARTYRKRPSTVKASTLRKGVAVRKQPTPGLSEGPLPLALEPEETPFLVGEETPGPYTSNKEHTTSPLSIEAYENDTEPAAYYVASQSEDSDTPDAADLFQNDFLDLSDTECAEDRSIGVDRMLSRDRTSGPRRSYAQKASKTLRRSKSRTSGLTPSRPSGVFKRSKRTLRTSRSVTDPLMRSSSGKSSHLRPLYINSSRNPSKKPSTNRLKSLVRSVSLTESGHSPNPPQAEVTETTKQRKKRKIHPHFKDTSRYDFGRAPLIRTFQIEGKGTKLYKVRPTHYQNVPHREENLSRKGTFSSFSSFEAVFHAPEKGKLYRIDWDRLLHPNNSLTKWCVVNKDFSIHTMFPSKTSTFSTLDLELDALVLFADCLAVFDRYNPEELDELILRLKKLTERMTGLNMDMALQMEDRVVSFADKLFSNAFNGPAAKHRAFFILFFFPVLQLAILGEILEGNLSFWKALGSFFLLLSHSWGPKSLYQGLVILPDCIASPMLDILSILYHISSSKKGGLFHEVAFSSFQKTLSTNISFLLDYVVVMANFGPFPKAPYRWKPIEYAVSKAGDMLDEMAQYEAQKSIFKTARFLISEFECYESPELFKLLVRLLKKRNFVSFPAEPICFKIFSKLEEEDFKKKDSLCLTFIKLALQSSRIIKLRLLAVKINFLRLAMFFEPNLSVFLDPQRPDMFLQTYTNKLNMYILITKLADNADYTAAVSRLTRSIMLQDDVACYDKAFEGLACFYKVQLSKNGGPNLGCLFEELFSGFLANFRRSWESGSDVPENVYIDILVRFIGSVGLLSSKALNQGSVTLFFEFYIHSLCFPRLFQVLRDFVPQNPQNQARLASTVVSSISGFCEALEPTLITEDLKTLKASGELIRDQLVSSMLSYMKDRSPIEEFVPLLGRVGSILVRLNVENWQSLNFQWQLYGLEKNHLAWLGQILRYGGFSAMRYDQVAFVEAFCQCLVRCSPLDRESLFLKELERYAPVNEWLNFSWLDASGPQLLNAFLSRAAELSKKDAPKKRQAARFVDLIVEELRKESLKYKNSIAFSHFLRRVIRSLCGADDLAKDAKDQAFLEQVKRNLKMGMSENTFQGRYLGLVENGLYEEAVEFLTSQILAALWENRERKFIAEAVSTISGLYGDKFSRPPEHYTESNLYCIVACISLQLQMQSSVRDRVWISLYYSTKILEELVRNAVCFCVADLWLLFHFFTQVNVLNRPPAIRSLNEGFSRDRALGFKMAFFTRFYSILNHVTLFVAEKLEKDLLKTVLETKSDVLKKRWMRLQRHLESQKADQTLLEDALSEHTLSVRPLVRPEFVERVKSGFQRRIIRVNELNESKIDNGIMKDRLLEQQKRCLDFFGLG